MKIRGWQYCVVSDLDFFNCTHFPNYAGVARVNRMTLHGWEPHLIVNSDVSGFKCQVMFRRRVWFPKRANTPNFEHKGQTLRCWGLRI